MSEPGPSVRTHQRQLEQTRAQVIDLLSRQAIERELVLPKTLVAAAMQPPAAHFHTDDRMRDAAQAFERYTLLAAPVVNLHEQLVGRITVDAVVEDIHARAQS